jgi:thiamine pyrophosphate-dependent acetolactate synthase large subunit-like protein
VSTKAGQDHANLASLGYALPATLGAQMAYPARKVIGIAGDGGFAMLMGDFSTAVRYNLPILYIVYNNFCYGFIELEEQAEGNPVFGTKLHNPDFAEFAKVFGGDGVVVKNFADLDAALTRGVASRVPFIIDVHTDPKELFVPPVLNAEMALLYAKSQLRGWFARPSQADK